MNSFKRLEVGFTAPFFSQKSISNPNYAFDTAGGRYILLGLIGRFDDEIGKNCQQLVLKNHNLFNDDKLCYFAVTAQESDVKNALIKERIPGIRAFIDSDLTVSTLYGSSPIKVKTNSVAYVRKWVILDPMMRVHKIIKIDENPTHSLELISTLKNLPDVNKASGLEIQAPILYLPNIFEPELCQQLISIYDNNGGEESGFMRQVNGKTVGIVDYNHKSRTDFTLDDEKLRDHLRSKISAKIVPQILKCHQFQITRMERYIVACYDSITGGHFRAHRDNTTSGTAHRKFAVSINLNDAFDGGEVGFPEFGTRTYKPTVGGAVVFSCSLLHHVTKVTSGKRYAFLPFLYDEASAKLREDNNKFLDENVSKYNTKAA
jgi:predicted 2-oxoglutarate/Fe(II)-dependent dioxygenase YbiX